MKNQEGKTARLVRYEAFSDFQRTGKEIIEDLEKKYGAIFFSDIYTFCVTPHGRDGGKDRTIFEYFYGKRPFDGNSTRHFVECGATMLYQRHDDGYVSCLLYPASSENMRRMEDFIFLKRHLLPQKLTKRLLRRQFKYFISYMQVTSLDGSPTWRDRFTIARLMLTKPTVRDGKFVPITLITCIWEVIKFTCTVGLSGFLLYLIQLYFQMPSPTISIYYL